MQLALLEINQELPILILSLLPNLTSFTIGQPGNNPDAIISQGYELRSRGPAVLGIDALDRKQMDTDAVLNK